MNYLTHSHIHNAIFSPFSANLFSYIEKKWQFKTPRTYFGVHCQQMKMVSLATM